MTNSNDREYALNIDTNQMETRGFSHDEIEVADELQGMTFHAEDKYSAKRKIDEMLCNQGLEEITDYDDCYSLVCIGRGN
jgi:hypothetical protein